MKTRVEAARQTAASLHTAEAALEVALSDAKAALARLQAAKGELGLTGTMGDAAIARWAECVDSIEQARAAMIESHQESYRVLQAVNIRGVAFGPTLWPTGQAAARSA